MNKIIKGIPYCAGCGRKIKKEYLNKNEYFCNIVADTIMKGIVKADTDGSKCVEHGYYIPIQENVS